MDLRVLTGGLITLALLSGCAPGPPPPISGGGGGDPALGRAALRLFVSPAGKPYRGAPDAPYPVADWFAAADADHDGKLTLAEFRKDAAAFFQELDLNHDGVIDGIELQHYEQDVASEILPRIGGLRAGEGVDPSLGLPGESGQKRPERRSSSPSKEEAGDRRPEGAGLYGLLDEPEPVAAADADFDGKITMAEFLAAADRRFAQLDRTQSGFLTLVGLPKTPAQIAGERLDAKKKAAEARARKR